MAGILIVDDSLVARRALGKIVTAQGHAVVGEAESGAEAVRQFTRLKPDLVTMDLAMTDSNGGEAISEILARQPEARIVVVSARQDRSVIIDALERGARHFIAKPFSREKVETVVNNVLQQNFDAVQRAAFLKNIKASCGQADEPESRVSARVLIVDDSAVARKSLREIVTELGHVVVAEAENGAQAFVEYTKLKPDVVTMDVTMQGLGGLETTSKIIASDPKAKIVVISAMEARRGIVDALERGARHFIIKPIRKEKVAAVINNVLRQEFNLAEHIERVQKLKELDTISVVPGIKAKMALAPYCITLEDNHLVRVCFSESFTNKSLQTLSEEIEEYLGDSTRILLDFRTTPYLEEALVLGVGKLIQKAEDRNTLVQAIAGSERFIKSVTDLRTEEFNYLANIIKTY